MYLNPELWVLLVRSFFPVPSSSTVDKKESVARLWTSRFILFTKTSPGPFKGVGRYLLILELLRSFSSFRSFQVFDYLVSKAPASRGLGRCFCEKQLGVNVKVFISAKAQKISKSLNVGTVPTGTSITYDQEKFIEKTGVRKSLNTDYGNEQCCGSE